MSTSAQCTSHGMPSTQCTEPRHHEGDHVNGKLRWTDEDEARCLGMAPDPNIGSARCIGHFGHPGACSTLAVIRSRPRRPTAQSLPAPAPRRAKARRAQESSK